MRGDNAADDGEPKPYALLVVAVGAAVVQAGEAAEDPFAGGAGDPGAVVPDGEDDARSASLKGECHLAAGIPSGVVEEVAHHPGESVGVTEHLARGHGR